MAEGAVVEASAMLPSRTTGNLREVDVAIRGEQAGHEVIVCVEASARSRKADRQWVDQMLGKHDDLSTSKLVLVSEKGFTKDAREAALARDAVPLAPEDLSKGDSNRAVVAGIPSLWPKVVTFSPESLSVDFAEEAPQDGWEKDPPIAATDDGTLVNIWEVVRQAYGQHFRELMEQIDLANIKGDEVQEFTLVLEPQEGEVIQVGVDGEPKTIYLVNANGQGYSLRRIVVKGKGEIVVSEIPLKHGRLGDVDVRFAYGEGKVGKQDALIVAEGVDPLIESRDGYELVVRRS